MIILTAPKDFITHLETRCAHCNGQRRDHWPTRDFQQPAIGQPWFCLNGGVFMEPCDNDDTKEVTL